MAIISLNRDASSRTGGPSGARRFLLGMWLASSALMPPVHLGAASAPEQAPVSVRESRGVYTVSAQFRVPQPPSTALAVLTDYERIPRFMPGVVTSIVRERSEDRVIVEQEAVSRMMMFSKRIHLLLEVHEEGDTVRFRDTAARSFSCYEGAWTLSRYDGQTVIRYQLSAKPSFDVPQFLLTRLLKRDAQRMIEGLRAEIRVRS